MSYAGISFESEMTEEQAQQLARLMDEARPTRPAGVVQASLEYRKGRGRLVAIWKDRDTLDRYLSEAPVPRGTLRHSCANQPAFERLAGAQPNPRFQAHIQEEPARAMPN